MKKTLFSLILAGAFAGEMQGLVFQEWAVSNGGNGHLYTVVGETPDAVMTWPDAQLEAAALGGYLVTIESAAELNFVRSAFGRSELFWTGLYTAGGSGAFTWSNGEPLNYTYFGGQNPDPTQDTAVIINQINSRGITRGHFGAINPFQSQYRAIVEFDSDAPPANPVPDVGSPLVLALIAGAAGFACRLLKR